MSLNLTGSIIFMLTCLEPLAKDGHLDYWVFDQKHRPRAYKKRTKVTQIQLEQDSGKSVHDVENERTLIDLNRAGVALLEIVTEPNLCDGFEAAAMVRELAQILKTIGICEAEMEKGHLRVDANVSVGKTEKGHVALAEVKNLNSFKFVQQAIEYEIGRQIELKEKGEEIVNETRTFDFHSRKTVPMRDKEVLQDYRYMPEPNLPPLRLCDSLTTDFQHQSNTNGMVDVNDLRRNMPVLPAVKREYWINHLRVPAGSALFILNNPEIKEYFDQCLQLVPVDATPLLTEWVLDVLREVLKVQYKTSMDKSPVTPQMFCELILLMHQNYITQNAGRLVLRAAIEQPEIIIKDFVEKSDLWKITDPSKIDDLVVSIMEKEKAMVEEVRIKRSVKAIRALVRSIVAQTKRKISVADAENVIKKKLLLS